MVNALVIINIKLTEINFLRNYVTIYNKLCVIL